LARPPDPYSTAAGRGAGPLARLLPDLPGGGSLITGASILLGPALGPPAEGVLGLILGALYLAVSAGLAERRLWAWRMNYWGLLLIQPITVAGVLGLWNVQRFPLLTAWHGGLVLLLGLWSAVNMRYFRRRRPLFEP
jgi:hypothetical protein